MTVQFDRSCPLCSCSSQKVKKSIDGYTIVSCEHCSFLYVANPDESTVSEGDTNPEDIRHTSIPSPRRRHHYICRLIEMKYGGGAKVLEVGAGYGALGKLLKGNGHHYTGFEPSQVRATVASDGGVNVIDDFYDPEVLEQDHDVVVLDNVLEHVLNPVELFKDASKSLGTNGITIVIVPSRYDLRRLHPGWNSSQFWIPQAHINFFRPTDLQKVYSIADMQMNPFPTRTFGTKKRKDKLFSLKSTVEKLEVYLGSLYTYGSKEV